MLELKGLERHALRLLEHASVADPYSPNALSFHLNFLYTHALDDAAAARLNGQVNAPECQLSATECH